MAEVPLVGMAYRGVEASCPCPCQVAEEVRDGEGTFPPSFQEVEGVLDAACPPSYQVEPCQVDHHEP